MNSKHKILVIVLLLFLILGIAFYFIIKMPRVQSYFFNGNRTTINVKIFIDDKELSLDNLIASCIFEKKDCEVNSKNGTFTTAGGNYGMYKFTITIPQERLNEYGKDILLNLNYLNANDWYISNSDCVIYLKTDNDILSGKTEVNVKYNDHTSQNYKNDIKSLENVININWGI
ncbi:hypothetical protein [[Clostridium] fimetarium]|uniref:Uncharacterized protein n=1 Tax=[Clostridium] fimetarium TaxID=99656 RepID=A0A1I0Q6W4_9FIRM|nr:hypothetical protein [[Clostridium] fimetarium]SEW22620.1 hypothetical protein SAMN05421659_10740 [[Clostridium] fimetarium]